MKFIISLLNIYICYGCITRLDCTKNGNCVNGECVCENGYSGTNCTPFCIHGTIIKDKCNCNHDINSNRKLVNGTCEKQCKHGNYVQNTDSCKCNDGWKKASIIDFLNYLKGSCSQFKCKSSSQCKQLLNINSATCSFKNYDCICPLSKINYSNKDAQCAGIMQTVSWEILKLCYIFYINAYWYFLWAFVILLPFGKNRSVCNCRKSWYIRTSNYCKSRSITCRGECTTDTKFSLRNDIALSIWILKCMIFSYMTLSITVAIFFSISFILLLILILIMMCMLLTLLLCMGICSSGGGDINSNSSCNCNCLYCDYNCDRNYYSSNNNTMYVENGPSNTNTNTNNNRSMCCLNIIIFSIYRALFSIIPEFPNNLWGGFIGVLMGTHSRINTYTGGNRFIDFMSLNFMNTNNLRNNEEWLLFIKNNIVNNAYTNIGPEPEQQNMNRFVDNNNEDTDSTGSNGSTSNGSNGSTGTGSTGTGSNRIIGSNGSTGTGSTGTGSNRIIGSNGSLRITTRADFRTASLITDTDIIILNGVKIIHKNNYEPLYNNINYTEYNNNSCSICMDENIDEYCEWITCKHIFCKCCTYKMVDSRENCRFPCPFCRAISNTIIEFKK